MPRVRYEELPPDEAGGLAATFRKPAAPPQGYTGNTVITEWLTLHCRDDWGSLSDGPFVRVRFADPEDWARAVGQFGSPLGNLPRQVCF